MEAEPSRKRRRGAAPGSEPLLLRPERFGGGSTTHTGAPPPGRPLPPSLPAFALLRGRLPPELTAYLAADPCVRALVESSRSDCNPDAVYRGHKARSFHAVGPPGSGRRRHEDLTGFEHDGAHPPAGPRLFAFAAAFREANAKALTALEIALRRGGHLSEDGEDLLPDFEQRVFGSITVQHMVAAAEGAEERGKLVLEYHTDSGASALHLGVSLGGTRRLRLRRLTAPSEQPEVADEGEVAEEELVLRPGDVYLSSPAAFAHTVLRGDGGGEEGRGDEAVAVQLRVALPARAMAALDRPGARMDPELLGCVADALAAGAGGWRLPALGGVKRHVAAA